MRTAQQIVDLGTRPDTYRGVSIPGSVTPSGYLALSGRVKHYQCVDDDKPCCSVKHRSPGGLMNCKNGRGMAARVEDGGLVAIRIKHIGASNGEKAMLVYPLRVIEEAK